MSNAGLCRLPELPDGIRILTNEEADRLRMFHPKAPSHPKHCPTCGGERRFRWYLPEGERLELADENGVVEYECPCEDQIILHRYLLWSGVGTAYQRLRWRDATGTEQGAIDAARYWLSEAEGNVRSGFGLLMTGNKGAGKTLLSVLMLKHLLAMGYDGYFTTFPDLITMLLKGWRSDAEMRWYHAMCRNASVLVIDDVGREVKQRRLVKGEGATGMVDFDTASAEFALESVLRHRISMALPTILTTNLTVEQLRQHYGDHLKSLLTEATQQYQFVGSDFRPSALSRGNDEKRLDLKRPLVVG